MLFAAVPVTERLAHYNWGALYTLDRTGRGTLVLDRFHGAPTGHATIDWEYAVRPFLRQHGRF
jgi:hypothetical protein